MSLSNEELELFELAYTLRMPVYKLTSEMPYEELVGWREYFEKRPVGWREDYRTKLLMQSAGVEESQANRPFPSLKAVKDSSVEVDKQIKLSSSLKDSLIFNKMLGAIGGDKIEF